RCPRAPFRAPGAEESIGGSVAVVGDTATVVWDDAYLGYDLGDSHPLNPVRLALTMSLARSLGVLQRPGVRVCSADPADDAVLQLIHDAAYLEAVRRAPENPWAAGHGLNSPDNPVFPRM